MIRTCPRAVSIPMALTLALASAPAAAQTAAQTDETVMTPHQPGPYVSLGVGFALPKDAQFERPGQPDLTGDLNGGAAVLAAAGYHFDIGLRSELEFGYRGNDVDDIEGAATGQGDARVFSFMANLVYELDLGAPVAPYAGGGIGVASLRFDEVSPIDGSEFDRGEGVFAYQAIAGLAWRLTERVNGIIDYRYFDTADHDGNLDNGGSVAADYSAHSVTIGLRLPFGPPPRPTPRPEPRRAVAEPAPEPAPAPAPAPQPEPIVEPPRTFLVFFDFDSADLTADARRIVDAAADYVAAGGRSRVIVTGHTDRAGPQSYNRALSERRAAAVKTELVGQGVDDVGIITRARGESEPLVETADGVREPQNRRVLISFGEGERLN